MPSFLLGFGTDAGPAVFLVRQEILGALDIGHDVRSLCLEGFGAGDDCPFDIDGALDLECGGALGSEVGVVEGSVDLKVVRFYLGVVDEGGGEEGGEDGECGLLHRRILYIIGHCWLLYVSIKLIRRLFSSFPL